MAADGLLPQVVRGKAGHVYFPRNDVPTWSECVSLLKEQRDRHLRRAASALRRLDTELEAVRNDITEARRCRHLIEVQGDRATSEVVPNECTVLKPQPISSAASRRRSSR